MSCLTVIIEALCRAAEVVFKPLFGVRAHLSRLDGMDVHFGRVNALDARCDRVSANLRTNIGLVCSVGVGRYEYLACSDLGFLRTYDKGFIIVPKT